MYMSKKIKQQFFGNIFFSKKKKNCNDEEITELQKINFQIKNELTIKKLLESISNYECFFKTISPECDAKLKKTEQGLVLHNDYIEDVDKQYILLNIPSDSKLYFDSFICKTTPLSKNMLHLIESFRYILSAITVLQEKNIVHFDIRPTNIVLDSLTQTPRIVHFKKSISTANISIQELKPYFYASKHFIQTYEIWTLEAYVIYYFLWLTNDPLDTSICSKDNIIEIIEMYMKTNKLNTIYTESQLNDLKQECTQYLLIFENFKRDKVIKIMFDYWNTWDLYSFSYMYCNICNILLLKTTNTYFISILKSYLTILYNNLHPNPKKRLSLIETQTKINHILYET